MPDPVTTVGFGVIATVLGKKSLEKILGPTADYLGVELQEFTKKRIENVGRVFRRAELKLGDQLNSEGSVPPKVLKSIINEGSYHEDDISIEYFGGILASSRTEISRDDRGARIVKTLDNLSTYQIRFHYLLYLTLSRIFMDSGKPLTSVEDRNSLEIFIPFEDFNFCMGFSSDELLERDLPAHILDGLGSDGLIASQWGIGSKQLLTNYCGSEKVSGDGIVCSPTLRGIELFLWGMGYGGRNIDIILSSSMDFSVEGVSDYFINAVPLRN